MASQIDIVIKFGGSAITDKGVLETLMTENLKTAARCIKEIHDLGLTCAVIHGAGSFGHHQAKKYEINKGLTSSAEDKKQKFWGYCLTRQSVTKLNKLVVDSLLDEGVPAIGCSPGTSWETTQRIPLKWPSGLLADLLSNGLVPVLHGDCCLDTELGCCILSGDTIIQTLCAYFDVKKVIFLSDVDGVFDRPPSEPGSILLKQILVQKDGTPISKISTDQSVFDVTGGIALKIKSACSIVSSSQGQCPVIVCNVKFPHILTLCRRTNVQQGLDCTVISMEDGIAKV